MRIIHWLLGAAATAAAGAYLVHRGKQGRHAQDFLEALMQGPVTIHADEPHIGPGRRVEIFRGEAGGRPFSFATQIDASGTKWIFVLDWGDGRYVQRWNSLDGETEHPLQSAYLLLRRHTAGPPGVSN